MKKLLHKLTIYLLVKSSIRFVGRDPKENELYMFYHLQLRMTIIKHLREQVKKESIKISCLDQDVYMDRIAYDTASEFLSNWFTKMHPKIDEQEYRSKEVQIMIERNSQIINQMHQTIDRFKYK